MDMHHIHRLEQFFVTGFVAEGEVKACIRQGQSWTPKDARVIIQIVLIAKGKYKDFMPFTLEGLFMQVNMIGHAAHVRFVRVHHHSDTHESIVQLTGDTCQGADAFLMVESSSLEEYWLNWFCGTRNTKSSPV